VVAAEPSAAYSSQHAVGQVPAGVAGRGGPAPVLLDGSAEGRLLRRLIDRLRDPGLDRIDMAVSFVMKSGLARIREPFGHVSWKSCSAALRITSALCLRPG